MGEVIPEFWHSSTLALICSFSLQSDNRFKMLISDISLLPALPYFMKLRYMVTLRTKRMSANVNQIKNRQAYI